MERDFDLVVFGATELTGRLVVEQLAGVDRLLRRPEGTRRWAVAGRDRKRVAGVLSGLSLEGSRSSWRTSTTGLRSTVWPGARRWC